MDKLCQFSTIVFAGNVSVLLIIAVTTDYWEYRGFSIDHIKNKLHNSARTMLESPLDTNSHILLHYYWDVPTRKTRLLPDCCRVEILSQPPALLKIYYYAENVTSHSTQRGGNVTSAKPKGRSTARLYESVLIMFQQYGNLFRDCDSLERVVRLRLDVKSKLPERCHNFITQRRRDDYLERQLPAVLYIELAAFGFAVVCIGATVVSFIAGAYGSMLRDRIAIVTASASALASGVSLTVAIALFHVKCHLLRRRVVMSGVDFGPYREIVEQARSSYYGWSFVLAWICVVLCFIHSVAWLYNAQELEVPTIQRRAIGRTVYHGLDSANRRATGRLFV